MHIGRTQRFLTIALLFVPAMLAPGVPAAVAEGEVRQVVVVFKTHFDIGYTDLARNVVARYRTTMIDDALKVVDQNRGLAPEQQFVWTLPGWPLAKIMDDWPGQTAERQDRLRQAFREGRFVVHALPFTTHTELLEPEDLVRGLGYASRLSRAASLELPRDAKMTDVPCHAWIMPTLLKHAGVDFLHLGCNAGSHPVEVPTLFWWEGPDGSRLLTFYSSGGYGTGLVPPADWPHATWLALIHTGDNHGPPTPAEVARLLEEAKQKLPGVRVQIGRLSDFADAILAEKPELPVVRGDMPDTWIHGPMCDPQGARLARTTRPAIAAAEAIDTHLRAWGVAAPDAAATIASAYDQSLLYGEHTWGGALSWITRVTQSTKYDYGEAWKKDRAEGRFSRLEESWEEHTGYIHTARDLVRPVLEGDMARLAQAVQTEGPRLVVFNPLPWKRTGLVRVARGKETIRALKAVDAGETLPVGADGDWLVFVARDVPPMGYRTYVAVEPGQVAPLRVQPESSTIESPLFKVIMDPARGTVRSLVDKRSGRELVDTAAEHGLGQYLYERFDADQVADYVKAYVVSKAEWAVNEIGKPAMPPAREAPYRAASPEQGQLRMEQSPIAAVAVFRAGATASLPHGVESRVIVYGELPYVDLEVTVEDKPADPWPEAGWMCLPLAVPSPRFELGRQGSIIDPAKDVVRGANRHLMGLDTGLAVLDPQGRGVGLCAIDHPLVSLETPGCWKYSLDFVPKKAAVYVNLFNNQWTTNFRLWNEGTWTSRVRVWPIERDEPAESLITPSLEARCPLQAAWADGPAGRLPALQSGLEVSLHGMAVTAFGANPDGPGTVLRLWELAGRSGDCVVRLPAGMSARTVQPVDLRGRPAGQALELKDGVFTVPVQAFAPASFSIE